MGTLQYSPNNNREGTAAAGQGAGVTQTTTTHTISNLLEAPINTKYPSTPFYWSPSSNVGVLYDQVDVIPGKPPDLASYMHHEDTWQALPGLVEYNDHRRRGGLVAETSSKIRYSKNTYMTLIWQPMGVHSGTSLPEDGSMSNSLILDIIHKIFWSE
jgi:hypothetical protein